MFTHFIAAASFLNSQDGHQKGIERNVIGSAIVSNVDPKVRVQLPAKYKHVGAKRWDLFDVADCELHMFVDADKNKRVRSYVWVQFEGYLDSKPTYKYEYRNGTAAQLWGKDFNIRARFGSNEVPKTGSDAAYAFELIRNAGYTLSPDLMNVRFVHLLPESNSRKELMIIYGEDMSLSGLTFADMIDVDKPSQKWLDTEPKLIERAKATLKLKFSE